MLLLSDLQVNCTNPLNGTSGSGQSFTVTDEALLKAISYPLSLLPSQVGIAGMRGMLVHQQEGSTVSTIGSEWGTQGGSTAQRAAALAQVWPDPTPGPLRPTILSQVTEGAIQVVQSAPSPPPPSPPPPNCPKPHLGTLCGKDATGAIIGIAIGGAVFVGLVFLSVFWGLFNTVRLGGS